MWIKFFLSPIICLETCCSAQELKPLILNPKIMPPPLSTLFGPKLVAVVKSPFDKGPKDCNS